MRFYPYPSKLKEFSRELRKNSTLGEVLLWQQLRAGSLLNYKFNRQRPLGNYIVDFYCKELNLVIEVDGAYHNEEVQVVKDKERQSVLEDMGVSFLRFTEQEVRKDMNAVLHRIEDWIRCFSEQG